MGAQQPGGVGDLPLGRRLERIEMLLDSHASLLTQGVTREEWQGGREKLEGRLDNLERNGSPLAQQNRVLIDNLSKKVDALERRELSTDAIAAFKRTMYVSILTTIGTAAAVISAILVFGHGKG